MWALDVPAGSPSLTRSSLCQEMRKEGRWSPSQDHFLHSKPRQAFFVPYTGKGHCRSLAGNTGCHSMGTAGKLDIKDGEVTWFQARLMGPFDKRCQVPRTQANTRARIPPPSPKHTFPAPLPASAVPKEGPWPEGLPRTPCPTLSLLTFQARKRPCSLFSLRCFPYFFGHITQAIKLISKACKGNNI